MKRQLLYNLIGLFIIVIIVQGCAPKTWQDAQKEYSGGNYYNAIVLASRTLKEKPNYENAVKFLEDILPSTIDNIYNEAQNAERMNKWDEAFQFYSNIEEINKVIKSLPPQKRPDSQENANFYSKNVVSDIEKTRNKAAEMHYEKGKEFEERNLNKEAAKEYSLAIEYIATYKDAKERYNRNRQSAISRIAVMPFDNQSGKTHYGMIGQNLSDLCIGEAMKDRSNMEFLEFVTRDKLDLLLREQNISNPNEFSDQQASELGKKMGVSAFVVGKVISVITDYPPETKTERRDEAQIYQGKDKPNRNVAATVVITTRQGKAIVKCSYQIVDVNKGTIVKSGTIDKATESVIKFGRFRGDEDALSKESRDLCSKEDQYPPNEEILVNKAIEAAAVELAKEITSFYK